MGEPKLGGVAGRAMMVERLGHSAKALSPMVVTCSGMVMADSESQREKALEPMLVSCEPAASTQLLHCF